MPLFVCEKCKCIENSALGHYWGEKEKLCSECSRGVWHGRFPKEKFNPKKWRYYRDEFVEKIINGAVEQSGRNNK